MLDTLNLSGKNFEELMALFFCEVCSDDDFYDVIAYRIANEYGTQLESMLYFLSVKRLRAAICGLGIAGSSEGDGIFLAFLTHKDPLIVSSAIDALRRTGNVSWLQLQKFLEHSSPFVRGAMLRFAKSRLGEESSSVLMDHLCDSDPIVRQGALDELDGVADKSALARIYPLLKDSSDDVRMAAKSLIESIESQVPSA